LGSERTPRDHRCAAAVVLRTAFARDFGWAWGKKIVIGTPKNWADVSKSETDGL
jgi:hypothetical protein